MFQKTRLMIIIFAMVSITIFLTLYFIRNSTNSKASSCIPGAICSTSESCFPGKCNDYKCECQISSTPTPPLMISPIICATTVCNSNICTCYTTHQNVVINPTSCPNPTLPPISKSPFPTTPSKTPTYPAP